MGRTRNPARDLPRSCTDCLAWGIMEEIRCRACRSFRGRYRDERECAGCGRTLRVKNGYCRLCWVQLSGGRSWEGRTPAEVTALTAAGARISHHQLFFDKMSPGSGPRPATARKASPAAPASARAWVRLRLTAPRPAPDTSPALAAAARVADRLAEARGWSAAARHRVGQGLRIALAGSSEDEPVQWSRALPLLHAAHVPAKHVAEVLSQAGMLNDDRVPAFDSWLDRKLDGLAGGIRHDTERWVRALKDGGPRSRPRSAETVRIYLGKALPALAQWSDSYDHLREVTRGDIKDFVRPLHGSHRHNTLVALRSLFAFCAADGVTFRNPATGIKVGRKLTVTVLQPLPQGDIDDAITSAVTPAARLIIALAGIHAARSSAIRSALLTDAEPASRRLILAGRPRPLDDLTARLLREWLEYRRARWPGTANPHLLVNEHTALGAGPASRTWVNTAQRGHAATIEALRVDRQLDEALASGADPLHLASAFGIDPITAVRYASSARQLLRTAAEQHDPAGIPANPRTRSVQES
jgi:hypothetical protein